MDDISARENYKRVTSILYPFSGLDKINPDIVAYAADRGTRVHLACEAIVQGLGMVGIDEDIEPYVDSFLQWWEKGVKVVEMEKRFYDDDLQITGKVDFITETEHGLAVVDLKTSYKPSQTWRAQGCAYAYLAKKSGYDIKKIYFIHLSRQGKEPKIYEYEVDDGFFFAVLTVWSHFYGRK